MFDRLKRTFETRISSLSWLDEATRKEALRKLASLRGHFLTWPQFWNETYVASLLQDVSCHVLCMWNYACFSFVPCFSSSLLGKLHSTSHLLFVLYSIVTRNLFPKCWGEKTAAFNHEDRSSRFLTILVYTYYTGYTKKNCAVSKVNKKFISHLTRAQPTPSAAATVQVYLALITILQCMHPGSQDTHPHGYQIHPKLGVACPL